MEKGGFVGCNGVAGLLVDRVHLRRRVEVNKVDGWWESGGVYIPGCGVLMGGLHSTN